MAQRPRNPGIIGSHFGRVESVIARSVRNEQREEIECTGS